MTGTAGTQERWGLLGDLTAQKNVEAHLRAELDRLRAQVAGAASRQERHRSSPVHHSPTRSLAREALRAATVVGLGSVIVGLVGFVAFTGAGLALVSRPAPRTAESGT